MMPNVVVLTNVKRDKKFYKMVNAKIVLHLQDSKELLCKELALIVVQTLVKKIREQTKMESVLIVILIAEEMMGMDKHVYQTIATQASMKFQVLMADAEFVL